jgi:copper chaperone CopZ
MSSYLHVLDGRIRVRFPQLKGSARASAVLRRELRSLDGVTNAQVRPLTGSVLVEFDPDRISTDAVLDHLKMATPVEGPMAGDASPLRSAETNGAKTGEISGIVAKKTIEFAAERLLLALLV